MYTSSRLQLKTLSIAVVIVVATGCAGSASSGAARSREPSSARPQSSAQQALELLLRAEQRGNFGAAYAYLSAQGRQQYPTAPRWTRHGQSLPAILTFSVRAAAHGTARATVRHTPALDPFRGLTAGEEHQVWQGRRTTRGWLLDADPQVSAVVPSDRAARAAATEWASAVQRCDQTAARLLQAVDQLFGDATAAAGVCGAAGPVAVGRVDALAAGPPSADIVDEYSCDALSWARVVSVSTPRPFRIVLAPLGDRWEIIGILPRKV